MIRGLRKQPKHEPKLFGLFAYRFDAELVPDLMANLSFCDAFVTWDDRGQDAMWYHEGRTRRRLIERARALGADWVMCLDPDERIEESAGDRIRELIRTDSKVIFRFDYRELYEPRAYRVDGIWGEKYRDSLFPLLPGQDFMDLHVHSPWSPTNPEYESVHTGLNIYHLKMIEPGNRTARKQLYGSLDPERAIQSIGYDYLDDETGLELQTIPQERDYVPPYSAGYRISQLGVPADTAMP